MDLDQMHQVMQVIHYYYPVGFQQYADGYKGTTEWRRILEDKINRTMEGDDPAWKSFIDDLKSHFGDNKVMNLSYRQFPGMTVHIEMENSTPARDIYLNRYLAVDLSLLGKYYTVFWDDKYRFGNYETSLGNEVFANFSILSNHSNPAALNHVHRIKRKITALFPDYSFINHKNLFDIKAAGIAPYDIPSVKFLSYSVYDLMMSDMYHNANLQVLF